jgi:DNA-directed RNA polymerase specialized sigma24 family protein
VDDEDQRRQFIESRSGALLRSTYLLVGDRALAEDLVQTALVRTYLVWSRIRDPGTVEAYLRRTMATTATSWWRGCTAPDRCAPIGLPAGDPRITLLRESR